MTTKKLQQSFRKEGYVNTDGRKLERFVKGNFYNMARFAFIQSIKQFFINYEQSLVNLLKDFVTFLSSVSPKWSFFLNALASQVNVRVFNPKFVDKKSLCSILKTLIQNFNVISLFVLIAFTLLG